MAAGLRAGVAHVELEPKLKDGFANAVEKDLDGPLSRITSKTSSWGAGLTKAITLPIVAGVGAGVVAIGAAGAKIDDALDNIRVGTGATGEALSGLEDSFRRVAARVPNDFEQVSTAIADLNTRTGATGPALEGLAKQVLTLSRITGEDLATTIETTTRTFGDWGIAVEDQAGTLDYLFRVSQSTGVGVGDLQAKLVQFGGPLRQLGFSLEESAALMGKFEKEGVNTELVLGSMRVALGKMARAGEAPAETLRRVMGEIKNAGDAGKANAMALELFGARAGPDMAAAIREGRFEVGALVDELSSSPETIEGAAAATDGWSETLSRLKNRVLLAVEPIATKLFAALDKFVPKIEPVFDWMEKAIDAFANAPGPIQIAAVAVVGLLAALGPLLSILGPIVAAVTAVAGVLSLPVVAIGALVAALVIAYLKFEGFRDVVNGVVSWLVATVPPLVAQVVDFLVAKFGDLLEWVRQVWPQVQEAISHVVNVVEGIIRTFVDVVSALWRAWGDDLLRIARTVFDTVAAVVKSAIDFVRNVIELGLALINGDWGRAWEAVKGLVGAVWDGIKAIIGGALEIVKSTIGGAVSTVQEVWRGAWEKVRDALSAPWQAIKDTVSGGIDTVVGFVRDLPGRVVALARGAFDGIKDAFRAAINFIIRGWNGLEFKIPGFKIGPIGYDGFTLGLPHVKELATGGPFRGFAVVGEEGPELVSSRSLARVHSSPDFADMIGAAISAAGIDEDEDEVPLDAELLAELLEEIRRLREDVQRQTDAQVRLARTG